MKHLYFFIFVIVMISSCNRENEVIPLEKSISEIISQSNNGTIVKSKGLLKGIDEKGNLVIEDSGYEIVCLFERNIKMELKGIKKGSKVIFTGKAIKHPFYKLKIRLSSIQKVDAFK